jgi:hypothetical protein
MVWHRPFKTVKSNETSLAAIVTGSEPNEWRYCEQLRYEASKKTGWVGMDWIHLAQDRDQWWVPMNVVMNFQVP